MHIGCDDDHSHCMQGPGRAVSGMPEALFLPQRLARLWGPLCTADADDSFTKEQMLAGEGAAQFATLTQPPLPRQQGGAGAWPVATATLPLPAPQPPLQRSATLPISYGPKPDGKDRGRGEAPCLRSVQGQRPPTCEVSLVDCRSGCRPWSEVQGHIFRRGCRRGPHRGRRAQAGSVRQPRHLPRHWEPLLGRHLQGKGAPCFYPCHLHPHREAVSQNFRFPADRPPYRAA